MTNNLKVHKESIMLKIKTNVNNKYLKLNYFFFQIHKNAITCENIQLQIQETKEKLRKIIPDNIIKLGSTKKSNVKNYK